MLKSTTIKDWLTSLKNILFGNDKAPQSVYGQNKHYKNVFLEFNMRPVYKPVAFVSNYYW